jgi:hypothetical protein
VVSFENWVFVDDKETVENEKIKDWSELEVKGG